MKHFNKNLNGAKLLILKYNFKVENGEKWILKDSLKLPLSLILLI